MSKVINNVKSPTLRMIGPGAAGLYGEYVVKKAINDLSEKADDKTILAKIGFGEEIQNKILNKKNSNGKLIFDKQAIGILYETSQMKDRKFVDFVAKNIDNVTEIKKVKEEGTETEYYEAYTENENGSSYAKMNNGKYGMFLEIFEMNGDVNTFVSYTSGEKMQSETALVTKDTDDGDEVLKHERVTYEKDNNTVKRDILDGKGMIVKSSTVTKFSPSGEIEDVTHTEFDNTDMCNIVGKTKSQNFVHDVKIESVGTDDADRMKSLTRVYTNPKTGRQEKIVMELSDVAGVYNSKIVDDKGNEKIESIAYEDEQGNFIVKKDYESFDGVRTKYDYKASKDGHNVKMHYEIKDVDGKALTTVDRTFNRVSPTLAYSSVNGQEYVIEKDDYGFTVTDKFKGKAYEIPYTSLFKNNDWHNYMEMFDKMSGDMLLDMYKKDYQYVYCNLDMNSQMDYADRILYANKVLFTFAHEQGHALDFLMYTADEMDLIFDEFDTVNLDGKFSTDAEFRKIYEQERADFVKAFPSLEQSFVDYFINKKTHPSGPDGGAGEVIAESNALFSTESGNDCLAARGYYLQKYFPRTLAYASKLIMPHSNIYVGKA
ncbi:hypothetical protein IJV79_03805 [bacterium]|nr:hypothetical protein [bacterium]